MNPNHKWKRYLKPTKLDHYFAMSDRRGELPNSLIDNSHMTEEEALALTRANGRGYRGVHVNPLSRLNQAVIKQHKPFHE